MKFMRTRLGTIVVTSLLCILVFAGITYASASKDVPGSVYIKGAPAALTIYDDASMANPATFLSFGDLLPGETSTAKTVYLRNTGSGSMTVSVAALNNRTMQMLEPTIGTLVYNPQNTNLPPGASTPMTIQFRAGTQAPSGGYNFAVRFLGN